MLVLFDRDGVIMVEGPAPVTSPDEVQLQPGARRALRILRDFGVEVAIITNQSAIARGQISKNDLTEVHFELRRQLATPDLLILVCPHDDADQCACRKPRGGLITEAIARCGGNSVGEVWLVGDMERDLHAAVAAGAHPALVLTGKGQTTQRSLPADLVDVAVWSNAGRAALGILESSRSNGAREAGRAV